METKRKREYSFIKPRLGANLKVKAGGVTYYADMLSLANRSEYIRRRFAEENRGFGDFTYELDLSHFECEDVEAFLALHYSELKPYQIKQQAVDKVLPICQYLQHDLSTTIYESLGVRDLAALLWKPFREDANNTLWLEFKRKAIDDILCEMNTEDDIAIFTTIRLITKLFAFQLDHLLVTKIVPEAEQCHCKKNHEYCVVLQKEDTRERVVYCSECIVDYLVEQSETNMYFSTKQQ
jgi:hypothetical protein